MKLSSFVATTLVMTGLLTPHVCRASNDASRGMVHLMVENDTREVITLTAGSKNVDVKAGEKLPLTLSKGDKIVIAQGGSSHPGGEIVATVTSALQDSLIHLR